MICEFKCRAHECCKIYDLELKRIGQQNDEQEEFYFERSEIRAVQRKI
jgi:hypothetical protein